MDGIYLNNKQFIWTIYVNFRGVSPWNSKSMYLKTIPMGEFIPEINFGFIINFGLVETYLVIGYVQFVVLCQWLIPVELCWWYSGGKEIMKYWEYSYLEYYLKYGEILVCWTISTVMVLEPRRPVNNPQRSGTAIRVTNKFVSSLPFIKLSQLAKRKLLG